MKNIKLASFLLVLFLSVPGCTQSNDRVDQPIEEPIKTENITNDEGENESKVDIEPEPTIIKNTVSFYGIGDNLIHDTIIWDAAVGDNRYDFSPIYSNIKDNVQQADISYINQETILGGDELGYSGYPSFNTPSDMIPSLIDVGFNFVTGSNNHTLDMGTQGVFNTLDYWQAYEENIFFTGIFNSQEHRDTIPVFEKNGLIFSVLSYTYGTNGQIPDDPYFLNFFDPDLITADVRLAKEVSDFVIVAAHWGDEHSYTPNQMQLEYAQLFADLGVDVVLGNHSHTIQPVKWVTGESGNETLVIYSLGNAVASSVTAENKLGGSISFDFVNEGDDYSIENVFFDPLVIHFNMDYVGTGRHWYGYEIYELDDYTEELANQHGLQGYLGNIINIETFQNKVDEVIDEEFLR